jgi:hypothetical protein
MTAKPNDPMMNAWKQQVGTALKVVEAITEESRKMHEFQLAAAVETHASAVATRERLEKAADAQEFWRIQNEWWTANLNRSLAYWREACEAAGRMQACISLAAPARAAEAAASPAPNVALFEMMNDAYKRWLETAGQIYTAPAGIRAADGRKAA